MTEQQIQSKIIKHIESKGGYVIKLIKTNKNGIPDLVFFYKGTPCFIEVKKNGGLVSKLQQYRLEELNRNKVKAIICFDFNKDNLDAYLESF